jgi:hypothetical protein
MSRGVIQDAKLVGESVSKERRNVDLMTREPLNTDFRFWKRFSFLLEQTKRVASIHRSL